MDALLAEKIEHDAHMETTWARDLIREAKDAGYSARQAMEVALQGFETFAAEDIDLRSIYEGLKDSISDNHAYADHENEDVREAFWEQLTLDAVKSDSCPALQSVMEAG